MRSPAVRAGVENRERHVPDALGPIPPGLIATLADEEGPDLPGVAAWPGTETVRLYGAWHPGEVVRVEHSGARLLIVGHCLADVHRIRADLTAALDRDDPRLLTRWPGAYTGLLVRPGELTAFTDLAGQFPLYHSRRAGRIVLASHPGVLADLHRRPADPTNVAARIVCPSVLPLWADGSPFRDIARVPGGGVLRLRQGTMRLDPATSPFASGRGSAETVRAALTEAVAARCASEPISADFSGGLDSTSLAFLAARHTTVEAVVYHHPRVPAADLAEAVGFSRYDPRIHLTTTRGDHATLPYADPPDPATGRPYPRLLATEPARGALAWRRSMLRLEHAAATGADLHITGEGGDAILGAAPSYLSDLARPGRLRRLARHCAGQAALRQTSASSLAIRAWRLAHTSPAEALAGLSRRLLRPDPADLTWSGAVSWWPVDGTALSWLTRALRAELAERTADPGLAARIDPAAGPAGVAALTDLRQSADTQRHLRELGTVTGVRVHAPFLDDAVVRACLAVPSAERVSLTAGKPLLAAALRGLVPQAVLRRRTKGDYSAEEYHGARAAAPWLYRIVDDSRLAAMGVIEPRPVRACLDRLLAGAPVPLGAMSQLVAAECWLRGREHPFDWYDGC